MDVFINICNGMNGVLDVIGLKWEVKIILCKKFFIKK